MPTTERQIYLKLHIYASY